MITATQIRNGERYFSRHLSANDYYSESETVVGHWMGKGAKLLLGGHGEVMADQFDSLRLNRNPLTAEKLTPRSPKVSFHDVVISAPKAFSIAAKVGGDERLMDAFKESVSFTFGRLESMAAVRLRTGANVRGEGFVTTGVATAAVFIHDTSRLLDPQVHAHLVFHNASAAGGRWLALQPRPMMEASKTSIRDEFYRDLASRVEKLGYEVKWRKLGFGIVGISEDLERRFSRRTGHRLGFENRYKSLFGVEPSKERIEHFIKDGTSAAKSRFRTEFEAKFGRMPSEEDQRQFLKDARSSDMKTSSKARVHELQQSMLNEREKVSLQATVQAARSRVQVQNEIPEQSLGSTRDVGQVDQGGSKQKQRGQNEKRAIKNQAAKTVEKRVVAAFPKVSASKASLAKSAAIRQMKMGRDLSAAMKGYPMALIAKQVRRYATHSVRTL